EEKDEVVKGAYYEICTFFTLDHNEYCLIDIKETRRKYKTYDLHYGMKRLERTDGTIIGYKRSFDCTKRYDSDK
ncbi:hypothetical protein COBT_004187, partial [Conglomerata obtusa]